MLFPNTWVVGTEYNFGKGLFGMRLTGSLNSQSSTEAYYKWASWTPLTNLTASAHLRDSGGDISPNQWKNPIFVFGTVQLHTSNGLRVGVLVNGTNENWAYDVWAMYTK
jgi:hypothetical protein